MSIASDATTPEANAPETVESPIEAAVGPLTQLACDIAAERGIGDPDAPAITVRAAHKDYSARGSRRAHWFRMVWRNGTWMYVTDKRLPGNGLRASERNATIYGDVFPGEVLVIHDLGESLDELAKLVVAQDNYVACPIRTTRAGIEISLPDGSVLKRPNPRKK
jgi:hypothetical protein